MSMYDSGDGENRQRDRMGFYSGARGGGNRSFPSFNRNGGGGRAPPDSLDRRPFKRIYNNSFHPDDILTPKRPKTELDGMEPMLTLQKYAMENNFAMEAADLPEKYQAYEDEYRKRQYKMFFDAHKNEEWFKEKYHPAELKAKFLRQRGQFKRRLDMYEYLKNEGHIDGLSLEPNNARNIVRLLNAVIVLLAYNEDADILSKVFSMKIDNSALADLTLEGIVVPEEEEDKVEYPDLIERYIAVFIRCIPPTMTTAELKEVCERCPGFVRLHHIFAVQKEANWMRKGVAAFKKNIDLRDVCFGINSIKVNGGGLVAYQSSSSGERVRVSHPYINNKETALWFLNNALKVLAVFDKKFGFFVEGDGIELEMQFDELREQLAFGVDLVAQSKNPLIEKLRVKIPGRIKDETLDQIDKMPASSEVVFERDENLLSALDEITLYLRVVYSFDLFACKYYEDEESLPNNLEIFHIRGRDPPSDAGEIKTIKRGPLHIFEDEIQRQLAPYYSARSISDSQLSAYGLMDSELAVEELITVNTVKMGDDKWLCPLSGKKFKGPEYVRKHIETKHPEAIDEAKAETLYFNNYLRDFEKPVDIIDNPNEHKNIDPAERRRMAPPVESPKKDLLYTSNAPFRRTSIPYKDLDAVEDSVVPNIF